MDELLSDFLGETGEMLAEIAGAIVAWEANPADQDRLDAIFRFVHTVKGSSGFLTLPRVTALSHAAEDALDMVRRGQRQADRPLVSAVLAIIDRLTDLTETIGAQGREPEGEDDDVIGTLRAVTRSVAAVAAPQAPQSDAALDDDALNQTLASWRSIRVPLPLLDSVMTGVTDMVLARNEFARLLRDKVRDQSVAAAFDRLSESVATMRQSVSQMRMQRVDRLFAPLPRIVRDIAGELGKDAHFTSSGGEVELDREMIENIRDPLTHIIRNAIDHGLESPDARLAAGKPASGTIRITARQSGNRIDIAVSDDGRGVDVDRVVAKAVAAGIISAADAAHLSAKDQLALIFAPGLSTAASVSSLSGRGVGMDVVKANVERIGGVVDLDNRPGEGLTITLRVPMTLTIISGLLVSAGGQQFAIPRGVVREIMLEDNEAVRTEQVGGGEYATVRGERLALVRLEAALGMPPAENSEDRALILVRLGQDRCFALSVAAVHDHEELVIKPAAPAVLATGLYAGTTLPDSGRPVLLLDTTSLPQVLGIDIEATGGGDSAALAADAAAQQGDQLLLFRDGSGLTRAVPLAVIDRLDDVAADALFVAAGSIHVRIDGTILPVFAAELPATAGRVKLLRIADGDNLVCYPVVAVLDIVRRPQALRPAASAGLVMGTMLIGDEPVELIDCFWLMGQVASGDIRAALAKPLCRVLGDSDSWARSFLGPMLELAGYRVAHGPASTGEEAGDILLCCDEAADVANVAVPVVRLRSTIAAQRADDASIYRYDRPALMVALAAGQRGRG
jgi:two-component system, chemotaxis family, sensor kinase CheA